MIRITETQEGSRPELIVEGTLSDGWTDALETSWVQAQSRLGGARLLIDLSGITYVDEKGCALLARIMQSGAEVRAAGIMNRTVVDDIAKHIEAARRNSGQRTQ